MAGVNEAELEEVEGELLDPSLPPAAAAAEPEAEPEPEAPPPPAANEVIEEAPSSSPRPIAASEAYEAESAPRHTPPPESGKQVAAPSVKPDSVRKSSVPPPSIEGHTLIGGWREPGMALPRDREASDVTRSPAVRVPPPPPPPPPDHVVAAPPPPPPPPPQAPPVARAAEPLRAEVTKAELPATANVATIEGTAPTFAPSTFGELLDATLAI
jgi:hypothetical protein